jgi:uncharacterized membrane protein YphA (DoxX/SURF4 family)
MRLRQLPARLATGAYIFHSGLDKWRAGPDAAAGLHGMASGAYPFLQRIKPGQFARMVSVGEMAVGAALLVPLVPASVAGAALTGFSGALVGLYARTPGMRKPGSVWPTQQGIGLAKDVWMLGIGLSLLVDAATDNDGGA